MRITLTTILLFVATITYSQVTIYYDNIGGITMKDVATHYRIATVDTVSKQFVGEIKDFWMNDSLLASVTYASNGQKEGPVEFRNSDGSVKVKGQYSNGVKSGTWVVFDPNEEIVEFKPQRQKRNAVIDSIEGYLGVKERFRAGQFIRLRDYPSFHTLIVKLPTSNDVVYGSVFRVVEDPPSFPQGMQGLSLFISSYLQYPPEALKNNVKGQVIVGFTIVEDGSMQNFTIVKSLGYGCDEEAVRVLKLLPDWKPGYQHGKPVKVKYRLPITF